MAKTILSPFQEKTLGIFKKGFLAKKFYLSGGTALAEFYLHHRKSEDLDFFTEQELDLGELKRFINQISKTIPLKKIEFQHGFGLHFSQYPFGPVQKPLNYSGLRVESLYDIAVNKVQTIAFHPRLRDFVDLYFILQQKKDWSFKDLLKKSFEKFEMKTDALQIGENLFMVNTLKDMPVMVKKINMARVRSFFLKEAKQQGLVIT